VARKRHWLSVLNDERLGSLPAQKAERLREAGNGVFRAWKSFGPWDSGGAGATRVLYSALLRAAAADKERFRPPPTAGSVSAFSDDELDEKFAAWFVALRSAKKGDLWHIKGQILALADDAAALCQFIEEAAKPDERTKLLDHILGLFSCAVRLGELTGRNEFADRKKAATARDGRPRRAVARRERLRPAVIAARREHPTWPAKKIVRRLPAFAAAIESDEDRELLLGMDPRTLLKYVEELF
jgi:hypothetical protein